MRPVLASLLVLVAAASPAAAIVGGAENGRLARSTLMVLSDRGGVCSGIVVAQDAVLTAGHCGTSAASLRIHWNDGEPVLIEPAQVARHPAYVAGAAQTRSRSVDMMLVRLPAPLPARFAPVALDQGGLPRAGETVDVHGYGVTREGDARSTGRLRMAALPVVEPYGPGKILIWASRSGAGACQGDSGGPMTRAGSDAVVAVTAFASGNGAKGCGGLTQGVLVGPQRDWIDRTLAAWGRKASWAP